jgi:valyl-tRNA synthetase
LGTWEATANRADFDAFYPTSLLVTGFDILFFWVARMIMLGCWFAGDVPMPDGSKRELKDSVPFREVYIHALVRDANREKMSKTKGNVVDPIEIVKQHGTDAVRFTLASMASPGTDIAFNIARTEGYRAFANKIWNAARFLFQNVDRAAEIGIFVDPAALGSMPEAADGAPLEARWIVAELHSTAAKVDESLANYRFDDAANTIYQFFWGSFCDWYLEIVKLRLDFSEEQAGESAGQRDSRLNGTKAALTTFVAVFETSLRLLSPFMPFITEEIWHAIYDGNPPEKSIALTRYPGTTDDTSSEIAIRTSGPRAFSDMALLQNIITLSRFKRKEQGVPENEVAPLRIHATDQATRLFHENQNIIEKLARVTPIMYSNSDLQGQGVFHYFHHFQMRIEYERTVDVAAERERLTKEIARLEKGLAADERQLADPNFLEKAPAQVVEGRKKQAAETRMLLEKARTALENLNEEN